MIFFWNGFKSVRSGKLTICTTYPYFYIFFQNLQSELEKTKVKYQELEKQKSEAQGQLDDLDKEVGNHLFCQPCLAKKPSTYRQTGGGCSSEIHATFFLPICVERPCGRLFLRVFLFIRVLGLSSIDKSSLIAGTDSKRSIRSVNCILR